MEDWKSVAYDIGHNLGRQALDSPQVRNAVLRTAQGVGGGVIAGTGAVVSTVGATGLGASLVGAGSAMGTTAVAAVGSAIGTTAATVVATASALATVAVPVAAVAGIGYGVYKLGRFLFSDD